MANQTNASCAHIRQLGGERYAAFLAAGYREYYTATSLRNTPYLLQRAICRGTQRLFYLNVWVYEMPTEKRIEFSPEVQYNTRSDHGPVFNVEVHPHDTMTPASLETFFLRLYDAMECEPYGD